MRPSHADFGVRRLHVSLRHRNVRSALQQRGWHARRNVGELERQHLGGQREIGRLLAHQHRDRVFQKRPARCYVRD